MKTQLLDESEAGFNLAYGLICRMTDVMITKKKFSIRECAVAKARYIDARMSGLSQKYMFRSSHEKL